MTTTRALVSCVALAAVAGTAFAQCNEPVWVQVTPPGPVPQARTGHALGYDVGSGKVFMFGGSPDGGLTSLNDTWTWDGVRWERVITPPNLTPAARRNHVLANWQGRPLLVAGTTNNGVSGTSDIYTWNGTGWQFLTDIIGPRMFHGAVNTPRADGRATVGGGSNSCGSQINDVFTFTAGGIINGQGNAANLFARTLHGMVSIEGISNFDVALIQGDINPVCGNFTAGATFYGNTATNLYAPLATNAPQPARWNFAASSSWGQPGAPRQGYIVFGGDRGNQFNLLGDTWHHRQDGLGQNTFQVTGPGPSPRRAHNAMVYDSTRHQYVLFGGNTQSNQVLGDTWILTFRPYFTSTGAVNRNECSTGFFTLNATAVGATGSSITYTWRRNGQVISNGVQPGGGVLEGQGTTQLTIAGVLGLDNYTVTATNACGSTSVSYNVAVSVCTGACEPVDFNGDGVYPDFQDVADFLTVLGGGACPTNNCASTDFNNDGVFPEDDDIRVFLRVLGGGAC